MVDNLPSKLRYPGSPQISAGGSSKSGGGPHSPFSQSDGSSKSSKSQSGFGVGEAKMLARQIIFGKI